jgi:mannan endo-1,4-beta-mannosidase
VHLVPLLLTLTGFVRVDGARFVVDGKPFAFVGANLNVMHGEYERAHAEATIAAARSDGLTVGRVWALGEGDASSPPHARAHELFRVGPDAWLDGAYAQLDRVLALARARGLRVILTLANSWDDLGGVRQYLAWAGLPTNAHDAFFSDARTRAWFRAHVERLVGRVNRVTGVRYADDPTIFAWELMNESTVATPAGAAARRAWIDEMATLVKTRDPHHLVTPGLLGYTSRVERAEWLAVCRLPSVDYCDSHLYPETTDRVTTLERLQQYIDDRAQLARFVAHKPLVFGEFGFQTTRPAWLERPRAEWFAAFLERVFFDGAAGALAWIYQPWTGRARDFGIYVDRSDTDDVRAILRRFAAVAAGAPDAANPRLGEAQGEALLYDPYVEERRSPHQHAVDGAIVIPPSAFAAARWERLGSWGDGARAHAYGAGDGWFEYAFWLPRAARPTLEARLSSEWPGFTAPPDGGSRVAVLVDGARVAALDVIPDDGIGRAERVPLGRLAAGRHTLRLAVAAGDHANGLCVYGDERTPLRIVIAPPLPAAAGPVQP